MEPLSMISVGFDIWEGLVISFTEF